MTQDLAIYLATIPRTSPWLFPSSRSRTGHITAIEKTYRRAVVRAGLDPKAAGAFREADVVMGGSESTIQADAGAVRMRLR